MKKRILQTLAAFLFTLFVLVGYIQFKFHSMAEQRFSPPKFSISEEVAVADLQLGERLFKVRSACIECHGADLAGAKIMENSPMGTIYGANISSYKLEKWTDEEIAVAIRYGIHKEGRSLRFMPSFDFEHLSKSDVAAIIKYIRSQPPARQESHENSFGPITKVLSVLGQMPVMFPASHIDLTQGFGTKPPEAGTAEFGSYLAKDCKGCHGPEYRGGKIQGGDPNWPEAANIRLGADPIWTEAKFKDMLATGVSVRTGKPIRLPMPTEIMKKLNETETKALWLYLSSLK